MRVVMPALLLAVACIGAPPPAEAGLTCSGESVTIVGTDADERLSGTPGDDVIHGGGGHDVISGGAGNDVICGGGRMDHLYGEAGRDNLIAGGGHHDDWLFGGQGPDALFAGCSGAEGQLLEGGAGDDRLVGAPCGTATMIPGAGDDHVRGTRGSLHFPGAAGGIFVDLARGVARGEGRDRIQLVSPSQPDGRAPFGIHGTDQADELYGHAGLDYLEGSGGDDVIVGRAGADAVIAERGAATVRGGRGDDRFFVYGGTINHGGRGSDTVYCDAEQGRDADLSFDGGRGRDWVSVVGEDATVDLARGTAACNFTETLSLEPPRTLTTHIALEGVENVDGSSANRISIRGDGRRNIVVGSDGVDDIRASGGGDEVAAGRGGDDVHAGDGDDTVRGGHGPDSLAGGRGDDFLDGEDGADSIDGGPGRDSCEGETEESCET